MWMGEWKAYVFWWLGWPLLGLLAAVLAVTCIGGRAGHDAPQHVQQVERSKK